MKKDLTKQIIVAILIGVPLMYVVLWQAGLGTTMDSIFKADATQLEQQLATEQRQRADRERELNTANEALKTAQDNLAAARARGETDLTALQESVTAAQRDQTTAQAGYTAANSRVTEVNERLEATPERQRKRLDDYYRDLIKANSDKGAELVASRTGPPTPTSAELEIIDQQIEANRLYGEFLAAKANVEKCKISEDPCEAPLEDLIARQDAAAAALRDQIALLTAREQVLNRGMQFEVSRIFAAAPVPPDQEPKKLSFLDVTNKIANWLITLVSSLAVTALIIGGFMMIISAGDETRLETGKTIFTYSLIGLAVTLMAYGIIATIQSLFY